MTRREKSKLAEEIGRSIAALRSTRDWTQGQLAREAGLKPGLISDYERGKSVPDLASLDRLLAAMQYSLSDLDRARRFVGACPLPDTPASGQAAYPSVEVRCRELLALTAEMACLTSRASAFLESQVGEVAEADLRAALNQERGHSLPQPEDRARGDELWERLKRYRLEAQAALVAECSDFWHWALCERICRESERTAPRDPQQAIALSQLALSVALQVRAEESWQNRLQAYAHAHVGNALRAKGELRQAAEAFDRFDALWGPDGPDLLEEARALDMKASLRRAERRFPEAMDLYGAAMGATAGDALRPWILINMSKTVEESGDLGRAIELLREAEPLVDEEREPRLMLCIRHNMADYLSKLGRFEDALPMIPRVAVLSRALGNEIDLLRLSWVEGRVKAGLGEIERGIEILSKVRGAFVSNDMAFDAALVGLELAGIHTGEGQTGQVKVLARHTLKTCQSQGVHREALAALSLFLQAAEQERVTGELVGKLVRYLEAARHDPKLRFELNECRHL